MHVFKHKTAAQKRAAQEKARQVKNLQDAQELIVELTELNATLEAQVETFQQQLKDVQELTVGMLEK